MSNENKSSSSRWDYDQWTRHFSEIEQVESFVSVLKVPFLFHFLVLYLTNSTKWVLDCM